MPTGYYGTLCCICFEPLTEQTCGVDIDGNRWDACPGACLFESGELELNIYTLAGRSAT